MNPRRKGVFILIVAMILILGIGCGEAAIPVAIPVVEPIASPTPAPGPIPGTLVSIPTIVSAPTSRPPPENTQRATPAPAVLPYEIADNKEDFYRGYDSDTSLVESKENLFAHFRRVTGSFGALTFFVKNKSGLWLTIDGDLPDGVEVRGRGIVIGGEVLSVDHIADEESMFEAIDPTIRVHVELLHTVHSFKMRGSEHDFEYTVEKVDSKPEKDIARFAISSPELPPLPKIKFGRSGDLEIGDFLYVVAGNEMKEAIVISQEGEFKDPSAGDFLMVIQFSQGQEIHKGDSGAAVFALRGGNPELVGLIHAVKDSNPNKGAMVKISVFLENFPELAAIP